MQRVQSAKVSLVFDPRITSAHAESTETPFVTIDRERDHLCACREYKLNELKTLRPLGSPLRMQRVPRDSSIVRKPARITSAHAESTNLQGCSLRLYRDHLCACREYLAHRLV